MTFQDRVVLVTGAAGGIGSVVARGFAAAGARVAGTDLDATPLQAMDCLASAHAGSLAEPEAVERILAEVDGELGPVDVVVHCAAVPLEHTLLHELAVEDWRHHLDVNLTGSWLVARAALARMVPRGSGALVLFSSTSALKPRVGAGAYSVSKAAVLALVRALAQEVGPAGVSVNAIVPGATRTPKFASNWGAADADAAFAALPHPVPGGRLVEPDQIAAAAMFLAAQPGASMTGTAMTLDAGYTVT